MGICQGATRAPQVPLHVLPTQTAPAPRRRLGPRPLDKVKVSAPPRALSKAPSRRVGPIYTLHRRATAQPKAPAISAPKGVETSHPEP